MDRDDDIVLSEASVHRLEDLVKKMKGAEFSIREVEIVDQKALGDFLAKRRLARSLWRPIDDSKDPDRQDGQ